MGVGVDGGSVSIGTGTGGFIDDREMGVAKEGDERPGVECRGELKQAMICQLRFGRVQKLLSDDR